jgi:hypothetical protein
MTRFKSEQKWLSDFISYLHQQVRFESSFKIMDHLHYQCLAQYCPQPRNITLPWPPWVARHK